MRSFVHINAGGHFGREIMERIGWNVNLIAKGATVWGKELIQEQAFVRKVEREKIKDRRNTD